MKKLTEFNHQALSALENLILVIITIATVAAGATEVARMVAEMNVLLADLLLLFIYLEVLAMVGQYYDSRKIEVRFPIYIGIIALARYLILDIKEMNEWKSTAIAFTILLLAVSVLVLRYGHFRFPYQNNDRDNTGEHKE